MSKIAAYLSEHGITQREFAASVCASPSYLSEIISGAKRPGMDLAFAIERATNGAVPMSSWVSADTKGAA